MRSSEFVDAVRHSSSSDNVMGIVLERVHELESGVEPIEFVAGIDKITYKYIHPESAVKAYAISKGFKVNDIEIHERFVDEIIEISGRDLDADELVVKASMMATLNYFHKAGNSKLRKKVHGGLFRGKVQDLSAIRYSGVAMCSEMASVSHNLSLIGGVVSAFMNGDIGLDKVTYGHAWQLVRQGDENKLFDVAQTVEEKRKDGTIKAHPFIGDVNAIELLTGDKVTVEPDLPEELIKTADYYFESLAPTTFEGFESLPYLERVALSGMSRKDHLLLSVRDAEIQFNASGFYKPDNTEAPDSVSNMLTKTCVPKIHGMLSRFNQS